MNEEKFEKLLEVNIKAKTNHGRNRTIRLTNFKNENASMLINGNCNEGERNFKINLTIDCDSYSYKI